MYSLIVVDVDDVVPRRTPALPNIYVGITTMPIASRYRLLERGKGPRWIRNRVVGLREDLSIPNVSEDGDTARAAKHAAIARLRSEGYTVNRDAVVWTVYVVELNPDTTTDSGTSHLYVGQTTKSPEQRLVEHVTRARNARGPLSSRVVAKRGGRLRMDLAPPTAYFDDATAKRVESEWAEKLRADGYVVHGGH